MGSIFKVGSKVTVTDKIPVPVAGSVIGVDHIGKTGKVRAYTDLSKDDIIHIIDLDEPMFVHLPGQPLFDPMTGEKTVGHQIDWIEVPGSCLK
jgi:hypothetical protein